MDARMTAREAVRVLRQNSVTVAVPVESPGAQRVLAKARERARMRRKA
jgi:hypothetical protein